MRGYARCLGRVGQLSVRIKIDPLSLSAPLLPIYLSLIFKRNIIDVFSWLIRTSRP